MWSKKKKPVDYLTTIGAFYEVTILEDVDSLGIQTTSIIRGELRGWDYDEDRGYASAIIWEIGKSCAEVYYIGDILAVKPIEKPLEQLKFFEPYKGRKVEKNMRIHLYRNLHTDNGYSIRCAKTGLVLAHCSTVRIKNAQFVVSESGRQKTIQERRKRVHAFVRGELVSPTMRSCPKTLERFFIIRIILNFSWMRKLERLFIMLMKCFALVNTPMLKRRFVRRILV